MLQGGADLRAHNPTPCNLDHNQPILQVCSCVNDSTPIAVEFEQTYGRRYVRALLSIASALHAMASRRWCVFCFDVEKYRMFLISSKVTTIGPIKVGLYGSDDSFRSILPPKNLLSI